jgi:hypothetical protein
MRVKNEKYSTCLPLLHAMEFVNVWKMAIRGAFFKNFNQERFLFIPRTVFCPYI